MFAGFPGTLACYDLRRGAANALDNPSITVEQRMQAMGHSRQDVFKHYIHHKVQVDTQAAYLGNPSRKDLIAGLSWSILIGCPYL
jgi:hypothetical protein